MTVGEYIRIVQERWRIIVAAVLIGLIAAIAVSILRQPEYTAKLTMYVSAQGGNNTTSAFQGAQLSQDRVRSYIELVSNDRVLQEAARRLGLSPAESANLSRKISASSAADSVIIDLDVTDSTPQSAAALANTVGDVFISLVSELERPIQVDGAPAVAVRVVQAAQPPTIPSSVGLGGLLAVGLVAGAVVGAAGAMLRATTDRSVKTPADVTSSTGLPVIGIIGIDRSAADTGRVASQDNPQSPVTESYRQTRTNMQFIDVDVPRKVYVVTSSLPGEGKTTTVSNIAAVMSAASTRTLVIDADLRRPRLARDLNLESSVGLTSVLSGRISLQDAIQNWRGIFDVLASGPLPPNPSELLSSRYMANLIADLKNKYDLVLIDTPPLLPVTDAAALAPSTDGVLAVAGFRLVNRSQLQEAIAKIQSVNVRPLGVVINMVPDSGPHAYAKYSAYYQTDSNQQDPVGSSKTVAMPSRSDHRR